MKDIFWDLDGSLSGVANTMITYWYDFNQCTQCRRLLPQSVFDDSMICNAGVAIRRVAVDGVTPNVLHYTDITIQSKFGVDSTYFLPLDIFGWVIPLVDNQTYSIIWRAAGTSAYGFSLTYSRYPYLIESIQNSQTILKK